MIDKDKAKIPSVRKINTVKVVKDTLKSGSKDSIPIIVKDTIAKKEFLEAVITHKADSLVRQDFKNKKVTLYKNAYIKYKDIDIKAGYIEIDNLTSVITAKGIKDSIGKYSELPVFKQGSQESVQDSIKYNFKSEKAKIWNLKTEQEGLIIRGEVSKKYNDSVVFIEDIKITSSQKENPDYYIKVKRAKFIKDKKLVAGRSQLVIADVPTPAILPFAYIPLTKGRASGFILPTWGESNQQGYFLQNGGYYFAINDYVDLAVLGDVYTNGSWGVRLESGYAKRYRFTGRVNFRYENLVNSLKGFEDYSKTTNYNISWSHSQSQKASPNSRFSASVNLGSSKYYRRSLNEFNNNSFLNNTLSSSISYSRRFSLFNMSLSVMHSQNTNTEKINMTLPSLNVTMDRIYPFAGKGAKNNALKKMGLSYSLSADNRIQTDDDHFFKKGMFKKAKSGIQQNVSLSTSVKVLKYFTLSPSGSYREVWYFKSLKKKFDDVEKMVVTDTISGFNSFRDYSASLSLSTTLYGMFKFKKGKIEAIRHTFRPSISYGYRPDFSHYYKSIQKSEDPKDILEYSPFDNGIYGSPSRGLSNSINFSFQNNIEAKLRKKDSTQKESEKLMLLNTLNFSTSYNIAADSLKWSPVRMSGGTSFFKNKLNLNFNATLDPYALDVNGRKINKFNINNGGSLFRITNAGASLNYSLSSKSSNKKANQSKQEAQNNSNGIFGEKLNVSNQLGNNSSTKKDNTKKASLFKANFPWNLRLAYVVNYSNNNRQNEISSHSLMFNGDIELTPKWGIGFSSGYDIKNTGFTYTQLRFSRDLDSWKLNFNWVPFGSRQTYYFFIGVKSSMLSDLKYDKRQVPDKRLF